MTKIYLLIHKIVWIMIKIAQVSILNKMSIRNKIIYIFKFYNLNDT